MKNRSPARCSRREQRGLTLVELLVVLTIIATLAAIIYPAVVDSMKKSQAAMIADRLDAIQKAKVQVQLDQAESSATPHKDSDPVSAADLAKYLVRFGQRLSSDETTAQNTLDHGTGGTIKLGTWGGGPWFMPADAVNNPYLAKYNIPTTDPGSSSQ
jgi:prepilin-type N-terminal cleavage/methylation domain-containing protein